MDPGLIELFVDGKEDGLPDSGRLDGLGLGEGSVVFMLFRQGWRWTACGSKMALSEDGLVATAGSDGYHLVTGGEPMTEGRHYWEVEITKQVKPYIFVVGAVRPGLDHDKMQESLVVGPGGARRRVGADQRGEGGMHGRRAPLLEDAAHGLSGTRHARSAYRALLALCQWPG